VFGFELFEEVLGVADPAFPIFSVDLRCQIQLALADLGVVPHLPTSSMHHLQNVIPYSVIAYGIVMRSKVVGIRSIRIIRPCA